MGATSKRPLSGHQTPRTRVLGAAMLAGGLLGLVTAMVPPSAHGSDLAVAGYGAVALAIGLIFLLGPRSVPEPVLGVAVALGTALITLGTQEGGQQTATESNEMLYVWACLYSFYFFRLPHALLQLALVGVAYTLLIAGTAPADQLATQWGVTLSTLLVAGLIVAGLRNRISNLIAELTQRARHDHLTGALNRHALEERAALELERARRDGTELSLIVLDIDQFKELNDRFGHHAGDEVLRRVAAAVIGSTRAIDATARLGGDEFAVILPGTGGRAAQAIAERLREAVRDGGVGADGSPIVVSAGIATAPTAGSTLDELWHAADLAMYAGKREGGDVIRIARRQPWPTAPPAGVDA